jgi:hypothetical protein
MEAMRQSWTDDRLDDFRAEMNRRFDEANGEMNRRFDEANGEMNRRFDEANGEMNRRFNKVEIEMHRMSDHMDGMARTLVFGFIAMTSAMLAGYAATIGLVLTLG